MINGIDWKTKLAHLDASIVRHDVFGESNESRYYKSNEVGFVHQDNKTCIKIADDGDIDLFVSDVCGVKADKQTESITAVGDKINIVANSLNTYTQPTGFSWNGHYLNPTLYMKIGRGIDYEDKNIRLVVQYERWDYYHEMYRTVSSTVPLFIKKPVSNTYNEGINKLLTDMGIQL